jgi:hypothetical protein
MSSGSSSPSSAPQATSQTVNQSNIPAYARPYFERMMKRAEAASNESYIPYQGERVAGATPDSEAAFAGARNLQNAYLPSFNQAAQGFTNALNQANRAVSSYDPNQVPTWNEANRQQYMSPYIQDVVNRAQAAAQRNFAESQAGRSAAAARAGAFGGSRAAIADEAARANYDQQFLDTTAQLMNQGYSNAQAQFMADRQAREQARQFGAELGLRGAGFGLQAGQAMQGLGSEAFRLGGAQAELMNRFGQQQQAERQQRLSQAYEDFLNQRDYERQNVGFLSSILRGIPVQPQSNVIQYQQQPNQMSQLLGMGLGAYGALR